MAGQSVIVIGGGTAGLSAGCYAQMNGYRCQLFEMHRLPGGLCTSWTRKGYTVDGCAHWLVGSSPGSLMNNIWRELGAVQGRGFVNHDQYMRFEGPDGRHITLYTDVDRLEAHLLEIAPEDRKPIRDLTKAVRRFARFPMLVDRPQELWRGRDKLRLMTRIAPWLPALRRWGWTSIGEFASRITHPLLREAFEGFFLPEMPALFMLMTFAWLHGHDAGYPIGGSLALSQSIERRFRRLGGEITYETKVERILVERGRAVGVRLADGSEHRADWVISAADGHQTLFKMLGTQYVDAGLRRRYEELIPFSPLVHIGLGIRRDLRDLPATVSGISLPVGHADPRLDIPGRSIRRFTFHPYNYDPNLAPPGATMATVMVESDYDAWVELGRDRAAYKARKAEIASAITAALDRRYPGMGDDIDMVDVATPLTFERYTGNWRGSYEGWIPTPANFRERLPKSLPAVDHFLMAGHWVEIGGGLPPAAYSGRHVVQIICDRDRRRFRTSEP